MTWSAIAKGFSVGALALVLSGCLPIPMMDISPSSPSAGAETTFDGSGSMATNVPEGTVVASYAWDFGDGQKASGAKATHTYAAAGPYTVTLKVIDSAGRVASINECVTVKAAEAASTTLSTTTSGTTPATNPTADSTTGSNTTIK